MAENDIQPALRNPSSASPAAADAAPVPPPCRSPGAVSRPVRPASRLEISVSRTGFPVSRPVFPDPGAKSRKAVMDSIAKAANFAETEGGKRRIREEPPRPAPTRTASRPRENMTEIV